MVERSASGVHVWRVAFRDQPATAPATYLVDPSGGGASYTQAQAMCHGLSRGEPVQDVFGTVFREPGMERASLASRAQIDKWQKAGLLRLLPKHLMKGLLHHYTHGPEWTVQTLERFLLGDPIDLPTTTVTSSEVAVPAVTLSEPVLMFRGKISGQVVDQPLKDGKIDAAIDGEFYMGERTVEIAPASTKTVYDTSSGRAPHIACRDYKSPNPYFDFWPAREMHRTWSIVNDDHSIETPYDAQTSPLDCFVLCSAVGP